MNYSSDKKLSPYEQKLQESLWARFVDRLDAVHHDLRRHQATIVFSAAAGLVGAGYLAQTAHEKLIAAEAQTQLRATPANTEMQVHSFGLTYTGKVEQGHLMPAVDPSSPAYQAIDQQLANTVISTDPAACKTASLSPVEGSSVPLRYLFGHTVQVSADNQGAFSQGGYTCNTTPPGAVPTFARR